MERATSLIQAAAGRAGLDLLIRHVRLVNVLSGEVYPADVGILAGRIACVEPPGASPARQARRVIDGRDRLAVPGLIDAHMHFESSLVTPAQFAAAALVRGTTAVAADPHEITNVMGLEGARLLWQASAGLPLRGYFLVPTCVPAAQGLETSGGVIGPEEVAEMLGWDRVLGLAEVMDAWAVVGGDSRLRDILAVGHRRGALMEGHNPATRGRDLQAYVASGIDSDHTIMTPELMREKLRLGVTVQLQERYLSPEHFALLRHLPADADLLLVTDDVSPDYLVERGHLDQVLRTAIRMGMPPIEALRSATIKAARRLRLYDQGAIAPGKRADLSLLAGDLADFCPEMVIAGGEIVVEENKLRWQPPEEKVLQATTGSVKLGPVSAADFIITAPVQNGAAGVRIIDMHRKTTAGGQVLTLPVEAGALVVDAAQDLNTVAVFERHGRGGGRALGVVRGLGLQRGAWASTLAHDSHNLLIVGCQANDMAAAANRIIDLDGGLALAAGGEVLAELPLPYAGLLSDRPIVEVAAVVRGLKAALRDLGVTDYAHPIIRITTLSLPVSTGLRLTDLGLVDADRREAVSLFV
ncbi:MAG: adenine deaminase [Chloroflexota bacterium]